MHTHQPHTLSSGKTLAGPQSEPGADGTGDWDLPVSTLENPHGRRIPKAEPQATLGAAWEDEEGLEFSIGKSRQTPARALLTDSLRGHTDPLTSVSASRGAWVAQSVKRPTSAQVTILRFASSSPASGSLLTAQSPAPSSDSVSPSLSVPPPLVLCLSLSLLRSQK